ncbi:MAG: acetyltransferase [Bacteroidota bacterium]|nr:acetyltransferase [Bacteroidota bacterium]
MSNTKKIGIIGSGDLGQLIAHHALNYCGFNKVLFFDDYRATNEVVNGCMVYGNINDVNMAYQKKEIDCLIIGIGYKHIELRKRLFEGFMNVVPFASVIHPSAYIDITCKIGNGVVILPGCVLDMNVELQDNVLLNTGCVIAHDSFIGAHSFLSPKVAIAGFSEVGQCCNIGINTTVIDNIKISDFVQTGGATVVINNLTLKGLYVGNPAKFIR